MGHKPQHHGWTKPPMTTGRGGMTVTMHHPPGGVGAGNGEPSMSTVTITQVKKSYPMETTSAPSDRRDWGEQQLQQQQRHYQQQHHRGIDDADDSFHFPSRISEEMLAADIRETTINCDDYGDHDGSGETSGRNPLIDSVNEQLVSIEELLNVQSSKIGHAKKFGDDKSVEARAQDDDDDDDDCLSEVVSMRDAGTTPPPQSPSGEHLTENDAIVLPTIIPRSLSDDNLYYSTHTIASNTRERDGMTAFDHQQRQELARFELDFDQTSDEDDDDDDDDDDYYRRGGTTPPFPLRLDFDDDGRGNHNNELSRYDDPLTSADHTDDEMAMSTPEDDLREDLEALRRTKARYDAFFQEISQSLNDSGNLSLRGSNSLISNDDELASRYSSETRTSSSLNNTLDSGTYDYERRQLKTNAGYRYDRREPSSSSSSSSSQRARAGRIMQTRTGSYDEEKFKRDEADAIQVSADAAKRNSLEMKYKLPGFCPDAHVTTGSLPVNASEFFFDSQF